MNQKEQLEYKNYDPKVLYHSLDKLSPLMFAARHGFSDYLEEKLANLNEEDRHVALQLKNVAGFTALHFAARYGELAAIDVLLKYDANLDIGTKMKQLPLHLIFNPHNDEKKSTLLFKRLLSKKAIEAENDNGDTVAHLAAEKGFVEILKLIQQHNPAALNLKNNQSRTPLLVAILNNNIPAVQYLLGTADKKLTDSKGRNGLHYAASYGSSAMLNELLPYFPVNAMDREKVTALHFAIMSNDIEKVRLLTKNGASMDVESGYGELPMHTAVKSLNTEMVAALLEAGGDTQAVNSYHVTPLELLMDLRASNKSKINNMMEFLNGKANTLN